MDGKEKHLNDVGLRYEVPLFTLTLPCVVKPLQTINLLLELFRQLIVKPLGLLVVTHSD